MASDPLAGMLMKAMAVRDDAEQPKYAPQQTAEILCMAYADYYDAHVFTRGDLVTWKPRMRHKKYPLVGQPAIVVRVLDAPVYAEHAEYAGTPYFREPFDVVIGVISNDDEFLEYHANSQRLMPWVPDVRSKCND